MVLFEELGIKGNRKKTREHMSGKHSGHEPKNGKTISRKMRDRLNSWLNDGLVNAEEHSLALRDSNFRQELVIRHLVAKNEEKTSGAKARSLLPGVLAATNRQFGSRLIVGLPPKIIVRLAANA